MNRQGSHEWLMDRMGRVTSSNFPEVMAEPRVKADTWTGAAKTYAHSLATQRLTHKLHLDRGNAATEHGHAKEDEARALYELLTGYRTEEAPFVPCGDFYGGSPDGFTSDPLLEARWIHEIKCPYNPTNHLRTLLYGMPEKHYWQCQGNMWVTNTSRCDFISYHVDFPPAQRLVVIPIHRTPEDTSALATRLKAFNGYIETLVRNAKEAGAIYTPEPRKAG